MNLGKRILRTAGITLAVVVGLLVALFFWMDTQWTRQDIRVDTGEIREVREGILWDSSPKNIHETAVTAVLKKYDIGMNAQGDPWVFFNRVHTFAKKGGDYPLEYDLLAAKDQWGGAIGHIHYGNFLDAVAQYRSPQEAALWWKSLASQDALWRRTQLNRWAGPRNILCSRAKPFTSKMEFDRWYLELMTDFHNDPSCAKFIPLFDEIYTLYSSTPSPQP